MVNLFEYTDFRKYLKDVFVYKKGTQHGFSYQSFAIKAGFSDKGFVHSVIHRDKNLSKESVLRISAAFSHSPQETEYFESLVFFNQASTPDYQKQFYERMCMVKPGKGLQCASHKLRQDQYEYFSEWYHSAIRSIIEMKPFYGDFNGLAKSLVPPVSTQQARRSVALLEQLGLVKRGKDGQYCACEKHVTTGDVFAGLAVRNFHEKMAELSVGAIRNIPKETRDFSGITLGISESAQGAIVEEIKKFREKIKGIADADKVSNRVYRLNIQLFPVANLGNVFRKERV